jgi:glycosyltransferase involved in cell wall biosynthesis
VLSGFPNVITIHGNMRLIAKLSRSKPFSYLWLSARLERFTIPRSGGVVCISRHTKEAVQGLAKKTWLVPNAADQAFFNLKNAPHPQPVILCVGNIIPLKNQNAFIRALDPVAERMQFKVVFVGGALSSDRYAREFGQLIITRPWCQHIGFADREILRNWLVKARLLALPSLEENCPMVLLEAMAAGLPVVAARVGGVPDIFEENVEGILFDPTNPESIRTAVVRTLEDPARAGTMAESAKNKALERYRPAIIAARHIDVYKDVLISAN